MATTATKNKGKKQRANSQIGKLRAPNLNAFYDQKARSIEPGEFTFRTLLVRPEMPANDGRYMILDRANTSLEWGDGEGSVLTGSISLRRPAPEKVGSIPILRGHRVRLQLFWGGHWQVLWDMQVPDVPDVDLKTGTITAELADPLSALQLNQKEWEFKKDKQHPQGWTADEITRFVCRDQRVRIGRLPKARKRMKKLKLKGSGLEVIRKAWAAEKRETTIRYVIRFRDNRLNVEPFTRPKTIYVIKGIPKAASTSATAKSLHPTTSIKATGHIKKGGKTHKIEETVTSTAAARRFGFSQKEIDYGHVDSRTELRKEARRDLAEGFELERSANLTIPGIPFLEKGSMVIWRTEEPGWHGKVGSTNKDRAFAYVTSSHHSLGPSSYDTELVLSQDDIYLADRERRDEERRDKSKKERKGDKVKPKAKAGGE